MTPEERTLEARECFIAAPGDDPYDGLEAAVRSAITVKLTPEIQAAVYAKPWVSDEDALAAAFRAAGFIVEE